MEKLLGVEAEINLTVNDDIIRKISKGSPFLNDILKELKPDIIKALKKRLIKKDDDND